jgi:hypothetical protein
MSKQRQIVSALRGVGEVVAPYRRDKWLGFALLRDPRVLLKTKLCALLLGAVGMLVIQALEIPLEVLSVVFGSPVGIEDGVEALVWPIVLAAQLLPRLAPKAQVEQLRRERSALP